MYIYNSRNERCKQPFGAVKTDEAVTFTIYLPKMHLSCAPKLVVYEMDQTESKWFVEMRFCGAALQENRYSCTFFHAEPALLCYYFELTCGHNFVTIKKDAHGNTVLGDGDAWQLTVYDKAMQTPAFLREGVIYQIFPDRFANSGTPKQNVPADRVLRTDWGEMPQWRPDADGEITNNDYFGGDLKGIEQNLDYLEHLGITVLYLNPIFEAHSNHRYNTADYTKIDPLLGTNADFANLAKAAKQRGISLLLDGVFSHTGSDSIYFNKTGRYGDGGAYNDPQSPCRDWYSFSHYPDKYESWWGFVTLPNVRETSPAYMNFICGENGVLRQWLRLGAGGFRLDVADELPDEFLDALHDSVKAYESDCAVIGEVWEDASNKTSYGKRRRYLLGKQLDSVMNYPFKDALIEYIRRGNSEGLYNTILQILENYPKPAIAALMNSLSTHDTLRAITALVGEPLAQNGREWQANHHYLPVEDYLHGCKLLSLAGILQFGLPGMPCVYYGDEAGLSGYRDPFNRCCYPWGHENTKLVDFFAQLGKIRREYPIFAQAAFVPVTFSPDVCCFMRKLEQECLIFAVNRSAETQSLNLPADLPQPEVLLQFGQYKNSRLGAFSGAVLRIVTDALR